MSDDKRIKFHQLLEVRLNNSIRSHAKKELTPAVIREIREQIRENIDRIFSNSNFKLTATATTWLTDQYFKSIRVSEEQLMADIVVINEYNLSELEFNDIQLLRNLFQETILGQELDDELQRRSVS